MTVLRETLSGKRILVTGGAGFIGSHLVDGLLAEGAQEVVVVDNLFLGDEANLTEALATGRSQFYRDDAEFAHSLEYVFQRHSIDVVFNCATKALNYSFLNPAGALSTNVTVVLNLLELQRRGAFKTLCHFSTSEVYGSAEYEPMDEAHPRKPLTTYAAGKAAADLALETYVRMFGLDSYIVRPFNNYGPRQNYRGLLAAVVPVTAWRILSGQQPQLHGDGKQTRDFIFVRDTVEAVIKLHRVMPPGESVNISADNQVQIRSLLDMICRALGYEGQTLNLPRRPSDVDAHRASMARLRALIDFRLTPFHDGLHETLVWYQRALGRAPHGTQPTSHG